MTSAVSLATALAQNLRRLVNPNAPQTKAYGLFNLELQRRISVSPSLTRLVFGGPDVALIRTLAPDQRVKLFFPSPDGAPSQLPCHGDWHLARRSLPPEQQPPMRTYTIRAIRPEQAGLDIEFVLHGETGPASTWATHAKPGDTLQIVAPSAQHTPDPGGYEWQPPEGIRHVLLIGDETALPAIAGILESYAGRSDAPNIQAFIEVPQAGDCLPLPCGPGTQLNWMPRDAASQNHGEAMLHAARELAQLPVARNGRARKPLQDVDIEAQILWELAQPVDNHFYAWIAGESAAVMAIRKHLITERGLDRQALTLMGYWRLGRALD